MKRRDDPPFNDHFRVPFTAHGLVVPGRSGFTLLELLVVVAILVMMAALVAPTVVKQMRETRVAQAAESLRETISRSRTFALDTGIDYQFRYEPNGRNFVVLPLELEVADANSIVGSSETSNYVRLTGQLSDGFRLQATNDETLTLETLEAAWFGQLDNALQLSKAVWSLPIIFRFDGTADDAEFQVTTDEQLTADLSIRGLTGSVSVSRVYTERG